MKRSKVIQLSLVSSVAALLTGCGAKPDRYCVDDKQQVIDPKLCDDPNQSRLGHYYHWYYGGARGFVPYGTRITGGSFIAPSGGFHASPSATSRGVIGAVGEAMSGHAGGGE